MKWLLAFLILAQIVLIAGCTGSAGSTANPVVVSETTAVPVAAQMHSTPVIAESKPLPVPGGAKLPLTSPKSAPPAAGSQPSPVVPLTPTPILTSTPPSAAATPATVPLEVQKVLNLGIMVHLEGWDDARVEARFENHAELLREYADLFEGYGAKLTLESKEMTDGAINWDDNILLEMEERGHAVGIHADVGGNASETARQMELKLIEMKSRLESLGVDVRHVSGICSRCDWVTAAAGAGFEFVTGTVAFALASLSPDNQVIAIPEGAQPAQYHEAYPFTLEGRLHSWRAENGKNWIDDNPDGDIVIIPSGSGLAYTCEEAQGQTGLSGDQQFTAEDIVAFEQQLKDILAYIRSDKSTQPYTYYLSWSFGKAFDQGLLEQWLQMVDKYVDARLVQWQTIPEMYDDYVQWEIDSSRRN